MKPPNHTDPSPDDTEEQIATWLENLHCSHWNEEEGWPGCFKSNCQLFRSLAEDIRKGEHKS